MRRTFAENNLPTPKFVLCDKCDKKVDMDAYQFPLIVKPTDRSGSRGVCKVYNMEELKMPLITQEKLLLIKLLLLKNLLKDRSTALSIYHIKGNIIF